MYNDPYASRRAQRRYARSQRRYGRYSNPLRGIASGIFILALIIGFANIGVLGGHFFLVMLFVGLAFAALFGSLSSFNRASVYGGFQGFVWMIGLAICFLLGFWPWILLPLAGSMLLGGLFNVIMASLVGAGFMAATQQTPTYQQQPYTPPQGQTDYPQYQQGQTDYPQYQQGYQPPPPQQTYQENQQQQYGQEPHQQYEQPLTQYPEQQELPPMQQ
jgi:hypothetical protein